MVKPTQTESTTNHGSDPTGNGSKYKGVRKRKWGKWVSEIRLPNSRERIWLGSYDSPEKAARAFDAAQYCLRGNGAKFNFPDNPPDIAGATSLGPHEIQAVASRFANESVNNNNAMADRTVEQYTTSSSVSVSDGGVATQVESHETRTDWSSLLSMLDSNEGMSSDYGFYPGLGHLPGDHFYPPPPPPPVDDDMDDDQNYAGDGKTSGEEKWCVVTGGKGFAAGRHLVVVRIADLIYSIDLESYEENRVLGEGLRSGRAHYVSTDLRREAQILG
ncbi:hypothetical protein Godav_016783, partial [Gossypium davidsonii]|nr:hypothetical protein [Gossypium davidsonii]